MRKRKGKINGGQNRGTDIVQRRNVVDNASHCPRAVLFQDRKTIERMKWDILRRLEEMEAEAFESKRTVIYGEYEVGIPLIGRWESGDSRVGAGANVFDRGATTKQRIAWIDLCNLTGWADEQIGG